MTPAEYLKARGWTTKDDRPGQWWPRKPAPWFFADERTAFVVQLETDRRDLVEHGSVRYVPTDEQATTSPLCAALAAQGATERDAIQYLHGEAERLRALVLKWGETADPIKIVVTEGSPLLVQALEQGGKEGAEALRQAQAIGEAWKALAKAERAYADLLAIDANDRRPAAFEACAVATNALRALGIDPVQP